MLLRSAAVDNDNSRAAADGCGHAPSDLRLELDFLVVQQASEGMPEFGEPVQAKVALDERRGGRRGRAGSSGLRGHAADALTRRKREERLLLCLAREALPHTEY